MYAQELKIIINSLKVSKYSEQWITIYGRKIFSVTLGNPSLAHQEVVSYVTHEPPSNKIRSLTAAIINAADNGNVASKITITQ